MAWNRNHARVRYSRSTDDAISAEERWARARLPFMKWLPAYVPVRLMRWMQSVQERVVLPAGMRREKVIVDGVGCEWLIPERAAPGCVLLYLHGGGFVFGWIQLHRAMVAELARRAGVRALAVDYRLAPEHPFPAALEDSVAVYRALLDGGFDAGSIVLAGDSAGGNLVLATLLAARDAGLPLPAAAVCLSPAADFPTEEEMMARGIEDAVLHRRALRLFRDAYVGKNDCANPLLSPLRGDLQKLPPLLVQAGAEEIMRADSERLAEAARRAGVDVTLQVYPRMWHVWQVFFASLPVASEALDVVAAYIRRHLGARGS